MHDSKTINGGTLVNGPLKEYCRQKAIVLCILFVMVFKKYVTPNYDQVNELQIVMFCLNSILMFSFYLQLNRPISF